MTWWQCALLLSLCAAAIKLVNQHFKQPAMPLMVWRGFGVASLAAPFFFVFGVPTSPLFWGLSAVNGVLAGFFDQRVFSAAARFGAGGLSRILALSTPVMFFLWWALHPEEAIHLAQFPWRLLAVLFFLSLCTGAAFILRRDAFDRTVFMYVLPAVICAAVLTIINKTAMSIGDFWVAATGYIVTVSFVAGAVNLMALLRKGWQHPETQSVLSRPVAIAGGLIVLFNITGMVLLASGLNNAPNPAFVGALITLDPLWIYMFNKWRKIPDDTHVAAGFVLLAGAIGLILVAGGR